MRAHGHDPVGGGGGLGQPHSHHPRTNTGGPTGSPRCPPRSTKRVGWPALATLMPPTRPPLLSINWQAHCALSAPRRPTQAITHHVLPLLTCMQLHATWRLAMLQRPRFPSPPLLTHTYPPLPLQSHWLSRHRRCRRRCAQSWRGRRPRCSRPRTAATASARAAPSTSSSCSSKSRLMTSCGTACRCVGRCAAAVPALHCTALHCRYCVWRLGRTRPRIARRPLTYHSTL